MGGSRNPLDILICITSFIQKWQKCLPNIFVSLLTPVNWIHLINNYNDVLDAKTLGQMYMLTGLTILFEPGFKFSFLCWNYKPRNIRQNRRQNHIGNVISVARCVKNGKKLILRIELSSTGLDGPSCLPLIMTYIHNIRIKLRRSAFGLSYLPKLLYTPIIYLLQQMQHMTTKRGLAGITLSNQYHSVWFFW